MSEKLQMLALQRRKVDLGLDSPLQPAHFSELSLSRTRALSRRCRREFFECNASLERRGCSGPILRHEAHPAPVGSSVSRARWECKRSEARKRRGCSSGSSEGLDSATSTRRKETALLLLPLPYARGLFPPLPVRGPPQGEQIQAASLVLNIFFGFGFVKSPV